MFLQTMAITVGQKKIKKNVGGLVIEELATYLVVVYDEFTFQLYQTQ